MKKRRPDTPRVRRIKRSLDPLIRKQERFYRVDVASGDPDPAVLDALNALQKTRIDLIGKRLRGYTRRQRLPFEEATQ